MRGLLIPYPSSAMEALDSIYAAQRLREVEDFLRYGKSFYERPVDVMSAIPMRTCTACCGRRSC